MKNLPFVKLRLYFSFVCFFFFFFLFVCERGGGGGGEVCWGGCMLYKININVMILL